MGLPDRLVAALRSFRTPPRRRSHAAGRVLPLRTRAAAANLLRPVFVRSGDLGAGGRPVSDWRGGHALRRYTGTHLYEALGDFAAVAEGPGHADINLTRSHVWIAGQRAGKVMREW